MPSPTMATTLPDDCSSATSFALSPGSTSASTLSMPSLLATASAVLRLSPVSITTSMPIPFSSDTASAEVGLIASAMPMAPHGFPSRSTIVTVIPRSSKAATTVSRSPNGTFNSSRRARLPTVTRRPFTVALTPFPARLSNPLISMRGIPSAFALRTMASPNGCSDPASTLAAITNMSGHDSSKRRISITSGCPLVRVPVLSKTTVVTLPATSSASPPLMRMPSSAPFPVPTMMAVGVANPRAQGQAITRTVMKMVSENANLGSSGARAGTPKTYQRAKAVRAITITVGTNTAATRSASLWMGALATWASSTNLTICARAVSLPTLVARTLSIPFLLMLAPMTSEPSSFGTGRLSPVIMLSSTEERPSMTTPSVGTFSPGRTTITSPTSRSSTGISTSSPSRTTRAVFA